MRNESIGFARAGRPCGRRRGPIGALALVGSLALAGCAASEMETAAVSEEGCQGKMVTSWDSWIPWPATDTLHGEMVTIHVLSALP